MNVICIEEKAFYALWDRMFKYVRFQLEMDTPDKWIDKKEANGYSGDVDPCSGHVDPSVDFGPKKILYDNITVFF